MARNPGCTVFIGNLDDKVGRVVDLYIPRDKETSRSKGYAFAEYETEEIAQYAVKLFSGLVRLHNKTLRFAISGQDKASSNGNAPVTPRLNSVPQAKPPQLARFSDTPLPQHTVVNGRIAGLGVPPNHSYDTHPQEPSSGLPSRGLSNGTYEYSRRVFGSVMNDAVCGSPVPMILRYLPAVVVDSVNTSEVGNLSRWGNKMQVLGGLFLPGAQLLNPLKQGAS
ncbi:hypothetical protein U9M48_044060 [Paspalum notatum var. saurae]|uniref:RRM domain-containing protein n=1 Tax=Paspalum notatum var. saurae TaxID=547442 RepID=A0AAQ3XJ70_PASNO